MYVILGACIALLLSFAHAKEGEDDVDFTCPAGSAMAGNSDSFHFRGTALGGYMVLEPWITPSLFYQFLGEKDIHEIGKMWKKKLSNEFVCIL